MGLIAQELDSLLMKYKTPNLGIIHKVDNDCLSLRYNDLMAPMIKAIQELTSENSQLKKQIAHQDTGLDVIKEELKQIQFLLDDQKRNEGPKPINKQSQRVQNNRHAKLNNNQPKI